MPKSDPFNAKSNGDPQGAAINKELEERKGNFFSELETKDPNELRTDEDKSDDGKKSKKSQMTVTEAYEAGLAYFAEKGYHWRLEVNGGFCGHTVYKSQKPEQVVGINYPADFKPLRPLLQNDLEDIKRMSVLARSHPDDTFRELWGDTIDKRWSMDMDRLAKSELLRQNQLLSFTEQDPLKLRRAFDPLGDVTGKRCAANDPTTWVPARKWFDESLHQVTFQDVFTIFPDAGRELLKLLIGRAMVGPTMQIPHGWDEVLQHGARMAGIVVGEPGAGKSTLFERGLIPALSKIGYITGNFQDISSRFGLADVALSDLAYKDDTTKETLRRLMSSKSAKATSSQSSRPKIRTNFGLTKTRATTARKARSRR